MIVASVSALYEEHRILNFQIPAGLRITRTLYYQYMKLNIA